MKVIVFGAGNMGKNYCSVSEDIILAVADNDAQKWGGTLYEHNIINPERIPDYDYDKIVIAIYDNDEQGSHTVDEILTQLLTIGVSQQKITLSTNTFSQALENRRAFAKKLSVIIQKRQITGEVAECGVCRGHFAGYLNTIFPDRKLYLFDTFTSFDARDLATEPDHLLNKDFLDFACEKFKIGNADIALLRCPNRDKVIIKQGYIPDTFYDVSEAFAFVNLDLDLYRPTLESLRFFAPRMSLGGMILVHDYYNRNFKGIEQAVNEFSEEYPITYLPIDDGSSIAIIPGQKV